MGLAASVGQAKLGLIFFAAPTKGELHWHIALATRPEAPLRALHQAPGPTAPLCHETDLPLKGTKKRKMQKNRENMRQKMVQN
jgi:hypothetical protein